MVMQSNSQFSIDTIIVTSYIKDKPDPHKYFIHNLIGDQFTFNEFETIEIEIDSDQYEVNLDCQAYYKDNELFKTPNMNLKLENKVKYTISRLGDFDIGYNPGKYNVHFKNKSGYEFDVPFFVESSFKDEFSIKDIKKYIEKRIEGISLDFNKKSFKNSSDTNNVFFVLDVLAHFAKEFERTCSNISSKFVYSLENKTVKDKYEGKQNFASIKKNLMSSNIYSVKKVLNVTSCAVFKLYLLKIKNILGNIDIDLETKINSIHTQLLLKQDNITNLNDKLNQIDVKKDLRRTHKINNIKSLDKEIKTLDNEVNKYQVWYNAYNKFMQTITRYLSLDIVRETNIKDINYNEVTNDKDLSFIRELINLLTFKTSKISLPQNFYYEEKKSSLLFETYGLIIIYDVLTSLGYITNDLNFRGDILSDSKYVFEKGNKKVILTYDHYCSYYKNASVGEIVSINSHHNKPDYTLTFYENDKVKNIVIIEMKYRSLERIFANEENDTKIDQTINDYYQLAYFDNINKNPLRIVNNVVLIYPSLNEGYLERSFASILGFNPKLETNENSNFEVLQEILNK